jgi:DNA uptake protein ComE-like DNA-binding protein
MNGNWKDLFSFNRRERNGILVLSTLIIMVIFIQFSLPYFVSNEVEFDTSYLDKYIIQLKKDSADWVAKNELKYKSKYTNAYRLNVTFNDSVKDEGPEINLVPHKFNPNTAVDEDWKSVGLSKGQISSINKYLSRGGKFIIRSDVAKMYVITDEKFAYMKPFIQLPDTDKKISKKKYQKQFSADSSKTYSKKIYITDSGSVELNLADTTQLMHLRGIGSYYARQIVYYREKLGGYYSVNQLFEIERMREETVLKIIPFLKVDSSLINKIHINKDIAPLMVKHPYITWNMAINIQDYRDFTHKYKSIHDLVTNGLLNEEIYSKLAPYIEL